MAIGESKVELKMPTLSAGTVGAGLQNEISKIEEDLMRALGCLRGEGDVWKAIGYMEDVELRARAVKERLAEVSASALSNVLQSPETRRR